MAMEHLQRMLRWIDSRRDAWRTPILLIALIAFGAGCAISLRRLDLTLAELDPEPLLLLMLALVPLTIAYSAVNMMLMGKAAHANIGFVAGIRTSVHAQLAELLPLPGGAIVRTAALIRNGGTVLQSTGLVLGFALLWICCAAVGAAIAMIDLGGPAIVLLVCGAVGAFAVHIWVANQAGQAIALAATGLRIMGICLVALRIATAFAAIHVALPWVSSLSFAFATILGSAAAIVPAGLGVSEGLSALLAVSTQVPPTAAFLAVALSRLCGIAINLILAALFLLLDSLGNTGGRWVGSS